MRRVNMAEESIRSKAAGDVKAAEEKVTMTRIRTKICTRSTGDSGAPADEYSQEEM